MIQVHVNKDIQSKINFSQNFLMRAQNFLSIGTSGSWRDDGRDGPSNGDYPFQNNCETSDYEINGRNLTSPGSLEYKSAKEFWDDQSDRALREEPTENKPLERWVKSTGAVGVKNESTNLSNSELAQYTFDQ